MTTTIKKPPQKLLQFINHLNLVDSWRVLFPNRRDYTFYSHPKKSYSRLDYIFISKEALNELSSAKIHDIIISDHAPVSCNIQTKDNKYRTKVWRMNRSLLNDPEFIKHINKEIDNYIRENVENKDPDKPPIHILWDAFKCYIRGIMIGYSSRKKKELDKDILIKEKIHAEKEAKNKKCTNEKNRLELEKAKLDLEILLYERAKNHKYNSNKAYYITANKPGKQMASLIKKITSKPIITLKDNTSGALIINNNIINAEFKAFYENLYKTEATKTEEEIKQFLEGIGLKKLTTQEVAGLQHEITNKEIHEAMLSFPSGKAPGMDGLPAEFYKTFWSSIGPFFCKTIKYINTNKTIPQTMNQSLITVCLKPGKSGEKPADYRPLSLSNYDNKILAKTISNRLANILPNIIHQDQTGFIKNRNLKTNIRNCLSITQYAKKKQIQMSLLAVDALKAFDRVELQFLFLVMEYFEIPKEIIDLIKTLYTKPRACIFTNGIISEEFTLTRGTKQGCPLSPILFALFIEPLAELIRKDKEIKGININNNEYKLNLYADDLVLYLTEYNTSIPKLFSRIEDYSVFSGYKINIDKTEIMPIGEIMPETPDVLKQLKWTNKGFRYLGCNIRACKKLLYKDNLEKTLTDILSDLQRWKNVPLNITGRIHLFRMACLPKLLFTFSVVPIAPPKAFYKKLYTNISEFIWQNKKPRISRSVLQLPVTKGGFNLPRVEYYHLAAQGFYINHIFNNSRDQPWIQIENTLLRPCNLFNKLFGKNDPKNKAKCNFIINSTVKSWKTIKQQLNEPITIPNSTKLWDNMYINPQGSPIKWSTWEDVGITSIKDLMEGDRLLTFEEIQTKYELSKKEYFKYIQISFFINKTFQLTNMHIESKMDEILFAVKQPSKIISKIYRKLQDTDNTEILVNIKNKWQQDLGRDSIDNWAELWTASQEITTNENLRLIQFKLMLRYYYTRDRIKTFNSELSSECLKCKIKNDSLIHAFWECHKIKQLWEKLQTWLNEALKINITLSPSLCLLNDTQYDSVIKYPTGWVVLLCSLVMKKTILQYWKDTRPPTLTHWKTHMRYILKMERSVANERKTTHQFNSVWNEVEAAL